MNANYMRQVAAAHTKTKTLSAECYLMTPTDLELFGENGKPGKKPPLSLHSGMSRMYLTIIDTMQKVDGRSAVISANFPAEDIDLAMLKTEAMLPYLMNGRDGAAVSESPAYTVPIQGKFGRQTAANILLAAPERRGELESQISWLSANLAKYPANADQIRAIKEALSLFDHGKLKGKAEAEREIYCPPCKYFPNRKDKRGCNVCYRIKVTCAAGKIRVTIENFYAPVVPSKAGTRVIQLSKADGRLSSSLEMTYDEWYKMIHRIAATKEHFEVIHFSKMWKAMEANAWKPNGAKAV